MFLTNKCRLVAILIIIVTLSSISLAQIDMTNPGPSDSTGTQINPADNTRAGILDDFNRADGPLGANWTTQAGSLEIFNNAARGGSTGLATFNGGMGEMLECDITAIGTGLQYTGLVMNYLDTSNCLFIKVQQQDGGGSFDHVATYYGNNGSGWGMGFVTLDTPFTTAHMKVELVGTTATITFSEIDGGSGIQTYISNGAPATGGTAIGIHGLNNVAQLDNFSDGVALSTVPTLSIGGILIFACALLIGAVVIRKRSTAS